nr:CDP-glycerol glycerophosphotransferase family protein [Lachnospiraceae bacterium]
QAKALDFDENMASGEDLKYVLEVMRGCNTIGVVADTVYMYRRRSNGQQSLVQSESNKPKTFTENLHNLVYHFVDQYPEGEQIPRFLQFNLMSFLQWRIMEVKHVIEALGHEEGAAYYTDVLELLKRFDDDIILGQKKLNWVYFYSIFRHKYGEDFRMVKEGNRILVKGGDTEVKDVSRVQINLEIMEYEGGELYLSVFYPNMDDPAFSLDLNVKYKGEIFAPFKVMDAREIENPIEAYGHRKRCEFKFPLGEVTEKEEIRFLFSGKAGSVQCEKIRVGRLTPFMAASRYEYVIYDDYMITHPLNHMYVEKSTPAKHFKQEQLFRLAIEKKIVDAVRKKGLAYLETGQYEDFRKTLRLRAKYFMKKRSKDREIWLITDRPGTAGDNGEALFRYLCRKRPKHIDVYYALARESKDYGKLSAIGKVLEYRSERHILIHMLADKIISSQADEFVRDICWGTSMKLRDLYRAKQVFLQHGITKDDISGWLNRYNKNLKMFVTAGKAEYDSILNGDYDYDEKVVALTGFPRFDRLEPAKETEKSILIMPTWRQYISSKLDIKTGVWQYNVMLRESEFFARYNAILKDEKLLSLMREHGYKFKLVLHPAMRANASDFAKSDVVEILGEDVEYRKLFAESAAMITDYSSTAFDFAYLGKPVIYYQFDEEEFFENHTYTKGYWDYRTMGFGPVITEHENLVKETERLLLTGCEQTETYHARVDAFFAYRDKDNCKRVCEWIENMD